MLASSSIEHVVAILGFSAFVRSFSRSLSLIGLYALGTFGTVSATVSNTVEFALGCATYGFDQVYRYDIRIL